MAGLIPEPNNGNYAANGSTYSRPNAPVTAIQTSGFSQDQFLNGIFNASQFPVPVLGTDGSSSAIRQDMILIQNLDRQIILEVRAFQVPQQHLFFTVEQILFSDNPALLVGQPQDGIGKREGEVRAAFASLRRRRPSFGHRSRSRREPKRTRTSS